MTFEARDSAAKVVPARFKMNSTSVSCGHVSHGGSGHGSLRTSGSQTASLQHQHPQPDRRAITQSFMQFSKGLALETAHQNRSNSLKVPQVRRKLERVNSKCKCACDHRFNFFNHLPQHCVTSNFHILMYVWYTSLSSSLSRVV